MQTGSDSSVQHRVNTMLAEHNVPHGSKVVFSRERQAGDFEESVQAFDTTGPGVATSVLGSRASAMYVGEGQEARITAGSADSIRSGEIDAYDLRSMLSDNARSSTLVERSTTEPSRPTEPVALGVGEEDEEQGIQLTLDRPRDGAQLEQSSVLVQGSYGSQVTEVKVNGYSVDIADGRYEKELALPEGETLSIEVRAENEDGLIIDTKTVSVSRDSSPPDAPTITSPGAAGSVVNSNDEWLEIVGRASRDAVGIIVNDYRLQKYEVGKPWRYLVDPEIGNVQPGENIYEVIAIDKAGNVSEPAVITIVWNAAPVDGGEGETGLTEEVEAGTYLQPGSLKVSLPSPESPYTIAEPKVAIEGTTSPQTETVSVNGFTLSLYEAGSTDWRYVADADEYNNFRLGKNTYTVIARDADGSILDVLRYIIIREQ